MEGKKVMVYFNLEEEVVDFIEIVFFFVEDMLKENGGIYLKGLDWNFYVLEDGLVIIG